MTQQLSSIFLSRNKHEISNWVFKLSDKLISETYSGLQSLLAELLLCFTRKYYDKTKAIQTSQVK